VTATREVAKMLMLKQPKWTSVFVIGLMLSMPTLFLVGTQNVSAGDFEVEKGAAVAYLSNKAYLTGSTCSYSRGDSDIFLARYCEWKPCELEWFVTWGYQQDARTSGRDEATSIFIDNSYIYITGYLTSGPPAFDKDVVILKYDLNGVMQPNFPVIFDNVGTDDVGNRIIVVNTYMYVVGTTVNALGDTDVMLLRYLTDGTKPQGWRTMIVDIGTSKNLGRSTDGANALSKCGLYFYIAGYSNVKHINNGNMDMMLMKVDAAIGTMMKDNTWPLFWDGSWGGFHGPKAVANSMASDGQNSLYITGTYKTFVNKDNAFILKYNLQGNIVWSSAYCPNGHDTYGEAITVDATRVYFTGTDYAPVFGGQGQGQGMGGKYDVFVEAREVNDGTYGQKGWTTTWDSGGDDFATGIVYTPADPPIIFVSGISPLNSVRGNRDALILKYDQTGGWPPFGLIPNLRASRTFGYSVTDDGKGVAQDMDFVYVVGATTSYGDGRNGAKVVDEDYYQEGEKFYFTGGTDTDVFILKYRKQGGDPVWYRTYDRNCADDCANAVVVSGDKLYVAGYSYSNNVFANGADGYMKTKQDGMMDILVMMIDKNTGTIIKTVTWDGPGDWGEESANALVVYDQAVYVTGSTYRAGWSDYWNDMTIVLKFNLNLDMQNFDPNNQNPAIPQPYFHSAYGRDNFGFAITVGSLNGVTRIFVAGEIWWEWPVTSEILMLGIDLTGNEVFAKTYFYNKEDPNTNPNVNDGARGIALRQWDNGRFDCLYVCGFTYATANGLVTPLLYRFDFDCVPVWVVADNLNDQNAAAGYSIVWTDNIYVVGIQDGTVNNWGCKAVVIRYFDELIVDKNTGKASNKGKLSAYSTWGDSTDGAVTMAASITADDSKMYVAGGRTTTAYHPYGSLDAELTSVQYNGGWVWGVARLWG
jgi:hypothetical protein